MIGFGLTAGSGDFEDLSVVIFEGGEYFVVVANMIGLV